MLYAVKCVDKFLIWLHRNKTCLTNALDGKFETYNCTILCVWCHLNWLLKLCVKYFFQLQISYFSYRLTYCCETVPVKHIMLEFFTTTGFIAYNVSSFFIGKLYMTKHFLWSFWYQNRCYLRNICLQSFEIHMLWWD